MATWGKEVVRKEVSKKEIGSEVRERKGDRKQDRMRGNKARTTNN